MIYQDKINNNTHTQRKKTAAVLNRVIHWKSNFSTQTDVSEVAMLPHKEGLLFSYQLNKSIYFVSVCVCVCVGTREHIT